MKGQSASLDDTNLEELVSAIASGDARAVAKAISLVENVPDLAKNLMALIIPFYKKKPRIGVTGSPGVGKSTLINQLLKILRQRGQRVSVVAVDPTSPFTGGAILGDRIRMTGFPSDNGVFIRSMGSRGSLGGVSASTANAVRLLEVYGSDIVIVETVGMGQTGFDIVDIADSVVLLLSPESGDGVQTMKAGVMEVADIYVVNKADRPGAEALLMELELLMSSIEGALQWKPPILKTCAVSGEGVEEILEAFLRHQEFLLKNNMLAQRRERQIVNELRFIVENSLRSLAFSTEAFSELFSSLAKKVERGEVDTYTAADIIISHLARRLAETCK